jgi:hypothetical protein
MGASLYFESTGNVVMPEMKGASDQGLPMAATKLYVGLDLEEGACGIGEGALERFLKLALT